MQKSRSFLFITIHALLHKQEREFEPLVFNLLMVTHKNKQYFLILNLPIVLNHRKNDKKCAFSQKKF